jgi:lipopolysaccharide transport system permease protein
LFADDDKLKNQDTDQVWDLIVRPKTGWLDLDLVELWRYRDLVMIFVWRDFVATYKQTVLGPLWFILQPLFTTVLYSIVFGGIARIPTGGVPPILFYLAGITMWNYFAECINRTSNTFISNANIFGKVYFPRLCVPVSVVISNLIRFGIQFALFLGFLAFFAACGAEIHLSPAVLLTPVLLLLLAGLGLGLGIIVSALTTRYRDLQVLVTFGVQLLMFATPIIYPSNFVPERYRWLAMANPLVPIIETFRSGYLDGSCVAWGSLGYSTGVMVAILCAGIILFNHVERTFMDTV